ncbi:MAG: CoB--CoM heterodisulfide reductase iron-sulfur subunit B family protein [Thermoplasmata archaeon]|nr:CoB--CoM heterodisulfide reductase iron-sulfur subunit B family protein [Thermoplasmata archaeon]
MRYALFLGCTIPVRGLNYELSARAVAAKLGIEFVDVEPFSCCGYPMKSTSREDAMAMAARNLAVAGEMGLDVCTLCSACTGVLTEAQKELDAHPDVLARVNGRLALVDREYRPGVKVKHFSRVLYEDVGLERLKEPVVRDLSGLRFAVHYGCHYLRPAHIYEGFDDPEDPHTVEELVSVTGAKWVDYEGKLDCCGGAILGVDQGIALRMSKAKLESVRKAGVDALVSICPFCTVMYEDNQRKIEQEFGETYGIPVLYYPQVLGLAYGVDPKELGFRLNKVKPTELMAKLGGAGGAE